MEVLLVVLAVIGAAGLVAMHMFRSGKRVVEAAQDFAVTGSMAVALIQQTPPDEARQYEALQAWEYVRG